MSGVYEPEGGPGPLRESYTSWKQRLDTMDSTQLYIELSQLNAQQHRAKTSDDAQKAAELTRFNVPQVTKRLKALEKTTTLQPFKRKPGEQRRSVLITGCSDGSLGAGLAIAFHARGLRVLATARDPNKMSTLKSLGIETLTLDVLSPDSIKECETTVCSLTGGKLDMLINNAGGGYSMPVADIDISAAKELFDLNVWSYISMTQSFLPLLTKAKGTIVNQTSTSSVMPTPHSSVYQASKAAAAMFSDHMRIELEPFGIKVVDLKTGAVHTQFHANKQGGIPPRLPENSIYAPVREETEAAMGNSFPDREDLGVWSKRVVDQLLKERPKSQIWSGLGAWGAWFQWTFVSHNWYDAYWRKLVGLDLLRGRLSTRGKV